MNEDGRGAASVKSHEATIVKSSPASMKEATHQFAIDIPAVEGVQDFPPACLDHIARSCRELFSKIGEVVDADGRCGIGGGLDAAGSTWRAGSSERD